MMLAQPVHSLSHNMAHHCHISPPALESSKGEGGRSPRMRRKAMESTATDKDTLLPSQTQVKKITDYYNIGKVLGNGGFGSVFLGICKRTGLQVAIKVIPKSKVFNWSKIGSHVVPREVALLHHVKDHKYIIKMLNYFEDKHNFYIVMEKPEKYIDLFDYITQKGVVSERSCRHLFRQILEAIQYSHRMGVVHRDIKDENILIDMKNHMIKLIDFGSGTFLTDELFTEYEGTRVYSPPEWLTSHSYHALPATIWSLGILLYDMLQGDIPFEEDCDIIKAEVIFHHPVSAEAEALVRWMLSRRPRDRPTLEQVQCHPWVKMSSPHHHPQGHTLGHSPSRAAVPSSLAPPFPPHSSKGPRFSPLPPSSPSPPDMSPSLGPSYHKTLCDTGKGHRGGASSRLTSSYNAHLHVPKTTPKTSLVASATVPSSSKSSQRVQPTVLKTGLVEASNISLPRTPKKDQIKIHHM